MLNRQFNKSLHGLRGFSSLLVFFGHSFYFIANQFKDNEYIHNFSLAFNRIGTYGVEIFFILSGYLIWKSIHRYDLYTFMKHRVYRVYPIFLFFTLLFFIGNSFMASSAMENDTVVLLTNLLFINNLFFMPTLTPNAWTVILEMWYYSITVLFVYSFRNKKQFLIYIAFIISCIILYEYPVSIYFIIGVVVSYSIEKFDCKYLNLMGLIAGICIVYINYQHNFKYTLAEFKDSYLMIVILITSTTIFFIAILKGFLNNVLSSKVFLFLGNISYTLYLLHPYPYVVLNKTFAPLLFGLSYDPILLIVLYFTVLTTVTIVSSVIIHRYVENILYNTLKKI